ncbi:replication-relaxation family protein [Actinoplanes sp. CA-030573]|uniref:replication-relaxation family protein n=1 Tax=Actinoplanes sp. CA-030573 TaxID=3239898 RepID=UPI003D9464F3
MLTSGQLARLNAAPARTVTYRLDRLLQGRLVVCARPGRDSGSSLRLWWLTPFGVRLVAGAPRPRASARRPCCRASVGDRRGVAGRARARAGGQAGRDDLVAGPGRLAHLAAPGRRRNVVAGRDPVRRPGRVVGTAGSTVEKTEAFVEVDLATMSQANL